MKLDDKAVATVDLSNLQQLGNSQAISIYKDNYKTTFVFYYCFRTYRFRKVNL